MATATAIGLDIGSTAVRAAELSFTKNGVTLERFGQVAVPEGAVRDGEIIDAPVVVAALRQLWSQTKLRSKQVVLGVANQRVIVREVDIPRLPASDVAQALPFQVQDKLPIPVETAVMDFHRLQDVDGPSGEPMMRGLLVAASRAMVLANVRAVESAGLRVTSVDLTPFAVLRAAGSRLDVDVTTEAVVDVGALVTNIVVHSGGVPRFVRILLSGGRHITDAVSEVMGLPLEDAEALKRRTGVGAGAGPTQFGASPTPLGETLEVDLALAAVEEGAQTLINEIRSSLDYYAASFPDQLPERVVLCGGGSLLKGLTDRLAFATRLPVVAASPLGGLRLGRTGLDDEQLAAVVPVASVPVGLAMGVSR